MIFTFCFFPFFSSFCLLPTFFFKNYFYVAFLLFLPILLLLLFIFSKLFFVISLPQVLQECLAENPKLANGIGGDNMTCLIVLLNVKDNTLLNHGATGDKGGEGKKEEKERGAQDRESEVPVDGALGNFGISLEAVVDDFSTNVIVTTVVESKNKNDNNNHKEINLLKRNFKYPLAAPPS